MIWLLLVLSVLSILYGIFVLLANSGTSFFLVWFGIGLLFGLLFVCHYFHWDRVIPVALKWCFRGVVILGLIVILITQGLILTQFQSHGPKGLDYIIVLGAQVRDDGPSVVLRYRLDRAVAYLEENPETKVIVSGGKGSNEKESEASVMKVYLMEQGVDESRIIPEDASKNTKENIQNSSQLLDKSKDRVGIVTNNFHVYRGLSIAKKQGYAHAYGVAASSSAPYLFNNMLREGLGILKDFAVGNL